MFRNTLRGGYNYNSIRLLKGKYPVRTCYSNLSTSSSKACDRATQSRITEPIQQSAKVLRHLQFTKRMSFEQGLSIQEQFVRANLDMKKLQSKIEQKLIALDDEYNGNATINSKEKEILDRIMEMKPNPMVLTFEFEPTYTGGKRIKKTITPEKISEFENFEPKNQIENPKPKFVQIERGGEITFHGPGQMVAYVIIDLKAFKTFPARCLISAIETATKNTLGHSPIGENHSILNIETKRVGDKTGVWALNDEKIASIGVHVRRSITSHGVCINVYPDLSYLDSFEMCGTPDGKATSILQETGKTNITVQEVSITFVRELAKLLGIDTVERIQTDGSEMN